MELIIAIISFMIQAPRSEDSNIFILDLNPLVIKIYLNGVLPYFLFRAIP